MDLFLAGIVEGPAYLAKDVAEVIEDPRRIPGKLAAMGRGLNVFEKGISGPERFTRFLNLTFFLAGSKAGVGKVREFVQSKAGRQMAGAAGLTPEQAANLGERTIARGASAQPPVHPLVEFAQRSLSRVDGNVKQVIKVDAPLHPKLIAAAKAQGIDLSGYNHYIDNYGVRHVQSEHGGGSKVTGQGQLPIEAADYAKVPDVLKAPDDVVFAGLSKTGQPTFRYSKRFNGTIYYVEEVRSQARGELMIKSAWKTKAPKP